VAENLIDLGWHQGSSRLRRSFAYTIVAPDESRVLGCAYIDPSDTHEARVWMWVRRDAYEDGLDPVVEAPCASGSSATGRSSASTGANALSGSVLLVFARR
jgi:hypothetical protein